MWCSVAAVPRSRNRPGLGCSRRTRNDLPGPGARQSCQPSPHPCAPSDEFNCRVLSLRIVAERNQPSGSHSQKLTQQLALLRAQFRQRSDQRLLAECEPCGDVLQRTTLYARDNSVTEARHPDRITKPGINSSRALWIAMKRCMSIAAAVQARCQLDDTQLQSLNSDPKL